MLLYLHRHSDIRATASLFVPPESAVPPVRKQLIDNYRILDIQSFVIEVNEMQCGAYDKARSILLAINQNIEFQSQGSSLYFIIEIRPKRKKHIKIACPYF